MPRTELPSDTDMAHVLAGHAPIPMWIDLHGIRYVNHAFETFVGETQEGLRGTDIARFAHPEDREALVAAFAKTLRESDAIESFRFRRADGAFRWMQVARSPHVVGDGCVAGYVGSAVDVTELKRAQESLMGLDRGKNEFIAMLAHELRNPLARASTWRAWSTTCSTSRG